MGCDIHAYIDYDSFTDKEEKVWASCFAHRIDFSRNYTLFSLMAGVRYDPRTDTDYSPLFESRGLPDNLSWAIADDYYLRVDDKAAANGWEGYVTEEEAKRWTEKGYSIRVDNKVSNPDWHSVSYLYVDELEQVKKAYESIDFYEASWFQYNSPEQQPIPPNATATKLTNEYTRQSEWYVTVGEKQTYPVPKTFDAIIAAMKALNGDNPKCSRLVFWFDN